MHSSFWCYNWRTWRKCGLSDNFELILGFFNAPCVLFHIYLFIAENTCTVTINRVKKSTFAVHRNKKNLNFCHWSSLLIITRIIGARIEKLRIPAKRTRYMFFDMTPADWEIYPLCAFPLLFVYSVTPWWCLELLVCWFTVNNKFIPGCKTGLQTSFSGF